MSDVTSAKGTGDVDIGPVQTIAEAGDNIVTGEHAIEISLNGKLANGKDYTYSQQFAFTKAVKPKLMGVTLAGPDSGQPAINVGDW